MRRRSGRGLEESTMSVSSTTDKKQQQKTLTGQSSQLKTHFESSLSVDGLAIFYLRIGLGLWVLWDMWYRFRLGLDFMTSSNFSETAALDVSDSPHKFILHQWWFARGPPVYAAASLVAVSLAAIWYMRDWRRPVYSAAVLWFLLVSVHGRTEHFNDSCDKLARNLILWTALIGADGWDPSARHSSSSFLPPKPRVVFSAATAGFVVQLVILYVAVVYNRTVDGWRTWFIDFTALEYTLTSNLGLRPLAVWVARQRWLCAVGTLFANVVELVIGFGLLLVPLHWSRLRLVPTVCAVALHCGIAAMIALPQFQSLSIIIMIGTLYFGSPPAAAAAAAAADVQRRRQRHPVRVWLARFLLTYMVYEVGKDMYLLPSIDGGNIGQGLRFNQYWVMFNTPRRFNNWHIILANSTDNQQQWDLLQCDRHEPCVPVSPDHVASLRQHTEFSTNYFFNWRHERFFLSTAKLQKQHQAKRYRRLAHRFCNQQDQLLHKQNPIQTVHIQRYAYQTMELEPVPLWPPVYYDPNGGRGTQRWNIPSPDFDSVYNCSEFLPPPPHTQQNNNHHHHQQ